MFVNRLRPTSETAFFFFFLGGWKGKGGGFSSHEWIWGWISTNHSPPALIFFFFLSDDKLAHTTSTFSLGSFHSDSANGDNCWREFSEELRVSSYPYQVPTLCLWPAKSAYFDLIIIIIIIIIIVIIIIIIIIIILIVIIIIQREPLLYTTARRAVQKKS